MHVQCCATTSLSSSKDFYHPRGNYPLSNYSFPYSSLGPRLWQPPTCLLSLWIYLSWIFHIYGLASVTLHSVHLCCSICNCVVDLPHFIYSLISWWTFSLFPRLTIVNTAAVNIHIQTFVLSTCCSSLRYVPRSWMLSHMVMLCLSFCGAIKLFPVVDSPFYISINNV